MTHSHTMGTGLRDTFMGANAMHTHTWDTHTHTQTSVTVIHTHSGYW